MIKSRHRPRSATRELRRREGHAEIEGRIAFAQSSGSDRAGQHNRLVGDLSERASRERHRVSAMRDDPAGDPRSADMIDDPRPLLLREIEAVLAQPLFDLKRMRDTGDREQFGNRSGGNLRVAERIEASLADRATGLEYEHGARWNREHLRGVIVRRLNEVSFW